MIITDEVWERWAPVMDRGDAIKIHESLGKPKSPHMNTIRDALKTRKCNEVVFQAISNYYMTKLEKYKEVFDATE